MYKNRIASGAAFGRYLKFAFSIEICLNDTP